VFNIPPFGSEHEGGIGHKLVHAYSQAGLGQDTFVTNTARWQVYMTDRNNLSFCTSGSWKLPNSSHRLYSNSIVNTVDYGVAVRRGLYKKLSNEGVTRTISILDVINSTKSEGRLLIMNDRPVFGRMGQLIDQHRVNPNIDIGYMNASEGPISMLKMASTENRGVGSVLIFPEEFAIFEQKYPNHPLRYLLLSEGSNFAPIRASCPNTKEGKAVISIINQLLDDGLRTQAFSWFLDALPNIQEIRHQALLNQKCIDYHSCKDPLIK
jgi:hypothetical protein